MNKKILFAALALPLAITACTEDFETLESQSTEVALNGDKITLGENFVLSAGQSEKSSRAAWITGDTDWDGAKGEGTQFMWIPKMSGNESLLDLSKLGQAEKDAIGLCYVNGEEVLTNYKFDHDGWVEWGQEFANTPWKCVDGVYYYDRNYLRFDALANSKIKSIEGVKEMGSAKGVLETPVNSAILAYDKPHDIDELNLSRAIFKTSEKTIFAGDYVTYYPWTDGMLEAGKLTATAHTKMVYENGRYAYRVNALNKYTFAVGYINELKGGTEAAEMSLDWVTKLLALNVDGALTNTNKIVLLDASTEDGNFINKMELTPAQVKAGDYAGEIKTKSQTIMIDFEEPLDWNYSNSHNKHSVVYVPMFETTIPANTYVLAINSKTGAAVAYQSSSAFDFTNVGLAKTFEGGCVTLVDFPYDVVTNETELIAADQTNSTKPILLLGDIELSTTTTLKKHYVGSINGVKVGSLILPSSNRVYTVTADKAVFDCDVTVQAPGCCHTAAGVFNAKGIEFKAGNVFENQNEVNFIEGYTNRIYGEFNNTPYVTPDAEGLSYLAVAPKMTVQPRALVYVYGAMNNNDADDVEGNNIQSLIKVELDGESQNDQVRLDGELSVVANGTLKNDAWIDNYGTMSNQTGKAENIMNNEGATYVLKIGGQLTGAELKNADNRRCDFIAEVDNSDDSRWATAWTQGLANIIKIVKEQNKTNRGAIYPFQFTLNDGKTFTVNNTNVQVIVENPAVIFIGRKNPNCSNPFDYIQDVEELEPVSAVIGRLLINTTGKTDINYNGYPYKNPNSTPYDPVQLKVDNRTWAGNECAAGEAVDAIRVAAGILNHNNHGFYTKTNFKDIRLSVQGDFDVAGSYNENGFLSQNGELNVEKGGYVAFAKNAQFNVNGGMVSADKNGSESKGIIFGDKVNGSLTGNLSVAADSYVQVNLDAVITIKGNVSNGGKMKWISRTGTASPGVVYCYEFIANPENWVNGTPIIKK